MLKSRFLYVFFLVSLLLIGNVGLCAEAKLRTIPVRSDDLIFDAPFGSKRINCLKRQSQLTAVNVLSAKLLRSFEVINQAKIKALKIKLKLERDKKRKAALKKKIQKLQGDTRARNQACVDEDLVRNPPPPTPTPDALLKLSRSVTLEDIRHLYRRAGLGQVPDEAKAFVGRSVDELVDFFTTYVDDAYNQQLELEARSWLDDGRYRKSSGTYLGDYQQDYPYTNWTYDAGNPFPRITLAGVHRYALSILKATRNQFHEKLAFGLLHDRLSTSSTALNDRGDTVYLMLVHLDLLREHSRSMDYRHLIQQIGHDPAMLMWLSGNKNIKTDPNENYARELMELFSLDVFSPLGLPNYSDLDVAQVARAFTGWQVLQRSQDQRARFLPNHQWDTQFYAAFDVDSFDDAADKTLFLGTPWQTGALDDFDVVERIFDAHPNTSNSLARFLTDHYVREDASLDLRNSLARVLREDNYNLERAIKTLLKSEEFYKSENRSAILRSPVERYVHLMRIFEKINFRYDFVWLADTLERQLPCAVTQPATVFGCNREEDLTMGQALLNSMNWITFPLVKGYACYRTDTVPPSSNPTSNCGYPAVAPPSTEYIQNYRIFFPSGNSSPSASQLVESFESVFDVSLSSPQRESIFTYLNNWRNSNGILTSETWNPNDNNMVRRKVSGVFRIFSSLPQFHDLK